MAAVGSADITRLTEALNRASQESGATTQQVLIMASNHILAEMESRVPVKTGNLRTSLSVRVEANRVIIGPDANQAPYAGYVEFGTKAHVIRPKSAKVLSFMYNGKRVFATKVNHPGTRAQPYVQPAFEAWVDSLGTMAAEANVKVITKNA